MQRATEPLPSLVVELAQFSFTEHSVHDQCRHSRRCRIEREPFPRWRPRLVRLHSMSLAVSRRRRHVKRQQHTTSVLVFALREQRIHLLAIVAVRGFVYVAFITDTYSRRIVRLAGGPGR